MNLFRHLTAIVLAALLALEPFSSAWPAATLLPPGEVCFQAQAGINGMVGLLGTITGGTGGTSGTYGGVALTGGSGSGATANVTVSGGAVTQVTILNPGIQYVVGDVLSAVSSTIGNVSGFSVPISSTSINSSLAGGQVFFYQPGGTIFKQTWFNADQAIIHQNTNPVQLDANGCAIVYGIGSYTMVVQDSLGNTVYSALTTDTSANNNTFWAGIAGGTPNTITVTDPGFNGTDGSIIQFIPVNSNTGPTTLNPSGFGAISIVKDTATGAVALSGGEIVANSPSNVVNVVYSASQANFHILNLVNTAAATTPQTLCGAIGLKIVNDTSTPNSKVDLTADQTTAITTTSTISRTSVSYVLNLTINGANGLDTGAATANTFYYIWAIDNGSQGASLASLSATAPTMPSGYSYKCRLGAMLTNGAAQLLPSLQLGARTQYRVNGGTLSRLPQINTGALGSGTPTNPVYQSESVSALIPPTATQLWITVSSGGAASTACFAAPNANYGGDAGNNPPPVDVNVGAGTPVTVVVTTSFVLESSNVFFFGNGSSCSWQALGWVDKVNAQ